MDHPEKEMQALMEEFTEDFEYPRNHDGRHRHQKISSGISIHKKPIVWAVFGIVAVIVMALFFFGNGDTVPREDLTALKNLMNRGEQRLNEIENSLKKQTEITARITDLQKSTITLERSEKALRGRLGELQLRIVDLEKNIASLKPKDNTAPVKPDIKQTSPQQNYHIVISGDTLWGIASQYGVSINDLRRLNKLNKNQSIHPGQKLILTSAQ